MDGVAKGSATTLLVIGLQFIASKQNTILQSLPINIRRLPESEVFIPADYVFDITARLRKRQN